MALSIDPNPSRETRERSVKTHKHKRLGITVQPQGRLYDFKPKIEDNDDMKKFIEVCFDPNSPMSGKLKDTLLQMMKGGGSENEKRI